MPDEGEPNGSAFIHIQGRTPESHSIIIHGLPPNTTREKLDGIVSLTEERIDADFIPAPEGHTGQSARVRFGTAHAAEEAKKLLDGRPNGVRDGRVRVVLEGSQQSGIQPTRRQDLEHNGSSRGMTTALPPPTSPMTSRYDGFFVSPRERISPTNGSINPPGAPELPTPHGSSVVENNFNSTPDVFSSSFSQKPSISTSRNLIDSQLDDEINDILLARSEPFGDANGESITAARRSTMPHLNTRTGGPPLSVSTSVPQNGSQYLSGSTPIGSSTPYSGASLGNMGPANGFSPHGVQIPPSMTPSPSAHRVAYPPINLNDHHPPCNTLYVGNLPNETSEEELKALFVKQRGYKRLCFRNKANGPMCFVEFQDIGYATRALKDLYGCQLSSSIKGGIRLSFSKNPLGVRNQQNPSPSGTMSPVGGFPGSGGIGLHAAGFQSVNGPPPGLNPPPGLPTSPSAAMSPPMNGMLPPPRPSNNNAVDMNRVSNSLAGLSIGEMMNGGSHNGLYNPMSPVNGQGAFGHGPSFPSANGINGRRNGHPAGHPNGNQNGHTNGHSNGMNNGNGAPPPGSFKDYMSGR